jgi:hypothetical protein
LINDLADINTVTVNVSGQGDYEYSIDEPTGPFQIQISLKRTCRFTRSIYINDKMVVGRLVKSIAILGAQSSSHPTETDLTIIGT